MRIAFIINKLGYGGAERVFVDDANEFARHGDEVFLLSLYKSDVAPLRNELDSRVHLVAIDARGPLDLYAAWRSARLLRRERVSTLISTLNDSNIFARWVILITLFRLRLVVREANTIDKKTEWQRVLDRLLWWVPTRVLAVSSEIRNSLVAEFGPHRVVLLTNAVDIPPPRERQPHGGKIRILSVGRLVPQKGYKTLIQAFGAMARVGFDFSATIVGEGPLRPELERQLVQEEIAEKVVLVGTLPHTEVLRLYAEADIFVLPSLWEGSPNVLAEAMAYGCAVVASQVGGVTDFLTESTGLLVSADVSRALQAALETLIKNQILRLRLSAAAQERARSEFSREKRFERLRAIVAE